jgi:hypothetical protein
MIQELWSRFPRVLEQNINGLLDEAYPNQSKAFQLYKSCQAEAHWDENFQKFSGVLEEFFSKPRAARKKSDLDRALGRPADFEIFKAFHLTFRTALVAEEAISRVASWAHNLMRVSLKSSADVISLNVVTETLQSLTNPAPFEKEIDFEFEDFCAAWKKTVWKLFGSKQNEPLNLILGQLRALKVEMENQERLEASEPRAYISSVYLTQTEIDWVNAVRDAAFNGSQVPRYPLSRGPVKQPLVDLERVVQLYEIVRVTKLPELLKHREQTRATIFARCDDLVPIPVPTRSKAS